MKHDLLTIVLPVIAFAAGSIPFGLLIVRWVRKTDVRHIGSGNIGATNVRRVAGTKWGVVTLICDVLKGALPTYTAIIVGNQGLPGFASWVALATICGHMYPLYFCLKPSGKGVATALGCFGILAPLACGAALVFFICLAFAFRRVSLASMGAFAFMPLMIWLTKHDPLMTAVACLIAGLIVLRHKDNIRRLIRGEEPRLGKAR